MSSRLGSAVFCFVALFAPSAAFTGVVTNADVVAPNDTVVAISGAAGNNTSSPSTAFPNGQEPNKLFDNDAGTKYLNFEKTGAGVIVMPLTNGPKTIVNGIRITTGGDAPERDPLAVTIEGTNDRYASSTLRSSWTLLYSGPSGLATDPGRSTAGLLVSFVNSNAYAFYRVLVTQVRDNSANSVQMSELELIGSTAPTVGAFLVNTTSDVADATPGNGTCDDGTGSCSLRGAIQEANALNGTDTIVFNVAGTVSLLTGLPDLTSNIIIDGPGANILTISRDTSAQNPPKYRVFVVASNATVQIAGVTIANGEGPPADGVNLPGKNGGGILNNGTLHLTAVAISGNVAGAGANSGSGSSAHGGVGGFGGGFFNAGTLTLTNSTVSGNTAGKGGNGTFTNGGGGYGGSGGGIGNSGTLTITNSTISENISGDGGVANTAGGDGGGIYNEGTMTIRNSTIVGNFVGNSPAGRAGNYGDIYNVSGYTLASTITNDISDSSFGQINSMGYNLIQANVTVNPVANNGTDIIGVATLVGALGSNGGPTKTCPPSLTSPAIEHGKNFATDFNGNPIATDQRGQPRSDNPNFANAAGGDGSDIGAFEVPLVISTVNSLLDNDDACTPLDCTLREALRASTGTYNIINFAVTGTIQLTGPLPDIANNVEISGPGSTQLTVRRDTGGRYRIFTITAAASVSISGLTVSNGFPADAGFEDDGVNSSGGGIKNSGTLSLSNVVVSGNHAGDYSDPAGVSNAGSGGGIYSTGTLTLTNCTVSNNIAGSISFGYSGNFGLNGKGGGIYSDGTLTITGTTVSGNTSGGGGTGSWPFAGGNGGGIEAIGTLTITNSTLSGNTAGNGGNNGVGGQGGGLCTENASGTITSTTITGNQTGTGSTNGHGGGIGRFGTGTVTIRNSIIAGNTVPAPAAGDTPDVYGAPTSSGYNLAGVQSGDFTQTGDQAGTLASPLNAMLGPLANNGGPTSTHTLLVGSPAIDKGSSFALATDQRGRPRPQDWTLVGNAADGADIGAVEADVPPFVASIVRASANPAFENTSVAFTVTFTNSVTGVDASDFALTTTGVSGASITNVSGSGTTYTVTVNTGDGGGSVRLDVIDDDSITSSPGGPLGGAGTGNGNFTSGETYTILDHGNFDSLVVTKTADTDDGTCDSDCSLREAIRAANQDPGPETITFAIPGCASSCTIDLLTTSSEDPDALTALYVNGDLTISGPGAPAQLVIRRSTDVATPRFRLLQIASGTVTIANVTLTNGFPDNFDSGGGGAVLVAGNLTINNSVITGNHGGVQVSSFGGGAITVLDGTLTLNDSVVSNNVADVGPGGAIAAFSKPVTLNRTTVSGNVSHGRGGGIFASNATLTLTDSTISGNHTSPAAPQNADAGGIFASTLMMTGCTVSGNYAADGTSGARGGRGGGMVVSSATITSSTISGNHTGSGGANPSGAGGNGGEGGGIFASFPVTITASTITGNYTGNGGAGSTTNGLAGNGGGISKLDNSFVVRNTIIAGNSAAAGGSGPDVFRATTPFTSGGFNFIGVSNGDFADPADQTGTPALPLNSMLGALGNNSGYTQTHKPLPGSPVIDAGKGFGLLTDQRGVARTFDNPAISPATGGDNTDIGSVEIQAFAGPANLVATATGTSVSLTWDGIGGVDHYEVIRNSGAGYSTIASPGTNSYTDTVPADSAHLYRVRAVTAAAETSDYSNVDLATAVAYTNDPLTAGIKIKSEHRTQLQTAVNAVRTLAGLGAASFTGGSTIQAAHVTELRSALASALTALGLPAATYTYSPTTGALIHALDFMELRNAMK